LVGLKKFPLSRTTWKEKRLLIRRKIKRTVGKKILKEGVGRRETWVVATSSGETAGQEGRERRKSGGKMIDPSPAGSPGQHWWIYRKGHKKSAFENNH